VEEEDAGSGEDEVYEIPQHESVTTSQTPDIEKANRTVFLGNVSSEAVTSKKAKKALIQHMSSFFESLQKGDSTHKIDSIRFRSTAYTNMLPKKASYVTQDLMESTTRSTNAYIVYTTKAAARGALKLNGTIVLGRHLRVDSVAHPTKTDPKRCIFVGNLGFVDDESAIQAAEDVEGKEKRKSKKNKKKEPSDIEEGLWREFGKCGTVENVRVVRDSKTRVGKGFAYVQFTVSIYL
jgi:nucleolar protein 12